MEVQEGVYKTRDGRNARVYKKISDPAFNTLAWVKDVGIVAINANGDVAYEHIPSEYGLDLNTWQSFENATTFKRKSEA